MRFTRTHAALVTLLAIALPAHALVDRGGSKDPRRIDPRRPEARAERLDVANATAESTTAARAFLARSGGRWEFFVDPRTARASLVQGEGIPFLPGPGNSLPPEAAPAALPGGKLDIDAIASFAEAFVRQNAELIGPPAGSLVLDRDASGALDDGRLLNVNYDWYLGNVPVEGAGVFVRINSGNIVQFGAPLVGPSEVDPNPTVRAEEAVLRLMVHSGDGELARLQAEPRLTIQPEDGPGGRLLYRLVWVIRYTMTGGIETWEGRVDAHTGRIVGFRDANAYGRVTGGVYPRTVIDPEVRVPFPHARVDGSQVFNTNVGGGYAYAGGSAQSGLNGQYFDTGCQGCSNPAQPSVSVGVGIGWLDFGLGGVDAVGNGTSTRADRNAFYHLTQVRRVGKKWLPNLFFLGRVMPANVNIQDVCNAYFDGSSVNFFRSGGGCNNTGEISDVMQHEWGHGLDYGTRAGDGATGEGTADVVALHMTHDALMGPYFGTNGGYVRHLDPAVSGLLTRTNIGSYCPGGGGPLGYEEHCEGEIYGQTSWDLAQALTAKHGLHTGWRTSERLFFVSLPNAGSYLPTGTYPIYSAYLAADDDDGNLANGTPNGAEIYQAFNRHGIAGTAAVSTAGCARPAQPNPTVSPLCDRVALSWDAIPGANRYQVLRADVRSDTAYLPIATVTGGATTYEDREVAPATDYFYVVMALTASNCESKVENPILARLPAQPILSVTAASVDDMPRGNRSGYADPGEEVDLRVTLANVGEVTASGIAATLVAVTPGVTVLNATDAWPGISVNGTGANQGILRFRTDPALVACGALLRFRLVPSDGSGCATDASFFDVRIGQTQGAQTVCDPTPACYAAPTFAGVASASPGVSCGEAVLSWAPAASNCANATLSYNVYRGIVPGFAPGPQSLVAANVAAATFTDTVLVPGATYHYVVRAHDSRSGEEGNSVAASVVAPSSPDLAAPVFAGLASVVAGGSCGETALSWAPALESCGTPVAYDVFRSTDPAFVPSAATLVATTFSPSYTDAALTPGAAYHYLVRARDSAGNVDSNQVRASAAATVTDRLIVHEDFETSDGGWTPIAPNDAVSGRFEWGDPEGTGVQPENDHTPGSGTKCWMTGLAALGGPGNNDVDDGLTTIRSPRYDLTGTVAPYVRYARFFSNDQGSRPSEDPLLVHVSTNDGTTWAVFENVSTSSFDWIVFEKNLVQTPTANMRFRFQTRDYLNQASLVEAGFDDFEIWDRNQGCSGCASPSPTVGTILVSRSGGDIVLDWSADPVLAARFVVYELSGPDFATAVRVGTTSSRTFVHAGAAFSGEDFYYRVAAVNACGTESALH